MKTIWRQHKKIIVGAMALVIVLSVVIGNVLTNEIEAEASGLLYSMNTRLALYSKTDFTILEIVPSYSESDYTYDEMGVFVTRDDNKQNPSDVIQSKYFSQVFRSDLADDRHMDAVIEMRLYGILKRNSRDNGADAGESEAPIYMTYNNATVPAITETVTTPNEYTAIPEKYFFNRGFYSMADNGNYKLAAGYYLGDDGFIYKSVDEPQGANLSGTTPTDDVDDTNQNDEDNTQNNDDDASVSENTFTEAAMVETTEEVTVSDDFEVIDETIINETERENEQQPEDDNNYGNYHYNDYNPVTLSGNELAEKVPSDFSAKYYTKYVNSLNSSTYSAYYPLPDGVTYVGDGSGNLSFTVNDKGYYWGFYPTKVNYKNKDQHYHSGGWFKTYVFGNKNSPINIKIVTKPANAVSVTDVQNADLVYISGTSEAFDAKGVDISAAVAVEIYNQNVANHKATIMDYDVLTATEGYTLSVASSKLDKLAALLWQADQKAIATKFPTLFDANENITTGTTEEKNADYGKILASTDTAMNTFLDNAEVLNYAWENHVKEGFEGNFVTGNLYVYDHHMDMFKDPKCLVDANDFFGNGDFNSLYTETAVNTAFGNVYAYIQANNINHTDYAVTDGVSPAMIIQYILCSDGSAANLVKSTLSVLELQPANTFLYNPNNYEKIEYTYASTAVKKNRDEFITKYINKDYVSTGKQGYVSFTSMSINEFICKNENIIENYDLIYIGSKDDEYYHRANCTAVDLYTGKTVNNANITDFSDYQNMEGMIYYNIGDTLNSRTLYPTGGLNILATTGFLDTEPKTLAEAQKAAKNVSTRYNGRDLNQDKLNELKTFLDAGHPVLVEKDLMCANSSGVKTINPTAYTYTSSSKTSYYDHGRIDSSSKMYEFFQYALGYTPLVETTTTGERYSYASTQTAYANFFSTKDVLDPADISEYLNAQSVYIELTSMPTEYSYETGTNGVITRVQYLQDEDDGVADGAYNLMYEFTVADVSLSDYETYYTPKLFVDVNADGKFSSDEHCDDSIVTYAETGEEAPTTTMTDANGNSTTVYQLVTGTSYKLTRVLPESFTGVVDWCLRVESIVDPRIQANEIGYTCVQAKEKEEIRILQINNYNKIRQFSWQQSSLNLESQVASNTSAFGKYLNNLFEYTVVVDTLSIKEFETAYTNFMYVNKTATAMDFFNTYSFEKTTKKGANMLVLGFGDDYAGFDSSEAMKAIEIFMDSGKPVLLTHDFIMFSSDAKQAKALRDKVGMDRYDVTGSIDELRTGKKYSRSDTADVAAIKAIEENPKKKAIAYLPGSTRNIMAGLTQGYTDFLLNWMFSSGKKYINNSAVSTGDGGQFDDPLMVDQMNQGQLTEYPYKIASSFRVAKTHGQYFVLDMESDSDNDGSSDMTVWYTLSYSKNRTRTGGRIYNAAAGDGANQFYIYNKGNITYTGAGHSTINQEEEIKLFVNTLIAAYDAVDEAPSVNFFSTSSATANPINHIAIPYDSSVSDPQDLSLDASGKKAAGTSSIQWNKDTNDYDYNFKDPNTDTTVPQYERTATYFRITDANFKKGSKSIDCTFYMELDLAKEDPDRVRSAPLPLNPDDSLYIVTAASGAKTTRQYLLDDGITWVYVQQAVIDDDVSADGKTSRTVVELPINVYEVADMSSTTATPLRHRVVLDANGVLQTPSDIQSGKMYGFYLPLAYLQDHNTINIFVKAQTYIINVSTSGTETREVNESLGFGKLDITKVDLLKLD